MALFGSKKNKAEAKTETQATSAASTNTQNLSHVIRHARITEKSTMHSQSGVYVFDVAVESTKRDIMAAVKKVFSVTPRMVRVVSVPTKYRRNMRTGRVGVKTGGKKAYVYLKKGDTLNI